MDTMWRVEVFGGLRAVSGGRELTRFRTRKTGALLGYLCLHADRTHPRDELAELLWPGCGTDDGRSSVSTALWSLRRQLQPPDGTTMPVLLADRYTVTINPEAIETDAGSFVHRLRLAGRSATGHERAAALGEAVELYRGEVMAGYDEEWLLSSRREYQQVYRSALIDLVDCLLSGGQRALALRYLGQAVRVAPDEGLLDLLDELQAGQPQPAQPERVAVPASRPLPDGTVTFMLAAVGTGADGLARLAAEVRRHQGHTVEVGDPLVAAFACAEDALGCATALHDASPEGLRVALDTGRATPELDRYFAPALEHAARLLLATRAGQTICSERTASLARLDLDPRLRLADLGSYGIPGSAQVERLFQVDAVGPSSVELRPPLGLVSSSGNLPRPPNRFCGREAELGDLKARLTQGEERLVTLLGPGGSGKTRLALEVCNRLSEVFGGSVWLVPLADLNASELMLQALLRALGIEERQQADPVQQVASNLGRRPALLLFDNAEHLLPSCGQQLDELVARCPTVRCLVTSRARLGVVGEVIVPLHPLPLPPTGPSPADMVTCPSVSLFVDRAQAAAPDFQLTEANAADVARLCVRLDGLPLALELAGAKAATLTPAQILAQLDERTELVASPRDRRPERHRSLRAVIAGSVGQLPAEVRRLLQRLAVFRGGWDLTAAEAVGDEELAADHLAHLQDLSLVSSEARPGARRFCLLETLREYAWEQLADQERDTVEERHAEYYLALCREAVRYLGSRDATAWFARLDADLANLRTMLAWLLDHRPADAVEACCALTHYFDIRGAWREGRQWLERAVAALPEEAADLHPRASFHLGWFSYLLGDNETAGRLTAEYAAASRRRGDPEALFRALYQASFVARAQGRPDQHQAALEEALTLARAHGMLQRLPSILPSLARVVSAQGDRQRALDLLDEAVRLQDQRGSRRELANILSVRVEVETALGHFDEARRLHEVAYQHFQEVGDRLSLASHGLVLGELARREGDSAEAERQFQAALAALRELGHLHGVAEAHQALGRLAAETGDRRTARLHLAECLRHNQQLGDHDALATALERLATIDQDEDPAAAVRSLAGACRLRGTAEHPLLPRLRERLGEAEYEAAWSAGWESTACYLSPPETD